MITSERQRKTHEKFGKRDSHGYVHCNECPLLISSRDLMCKANSHYNRSTREWEFDEVKEVVE